MISENELTDLLVNQGKSFSEISKLTGTNPGNLSRMAKKLGIKSNHINTINQIKLPIEEIYNKYINGTSLHALHLEYNRPVARIKRHLLLNYPDIKFRSMDDAKRPSLLNDKTKLASLIGNGKSSADIAKKISVKKSVVEAALKRLSIEINAEKPIKTVIKPFDGIFTEYPINEVYYGDWFKIFDTPDKCYDELVKIGFLGVRHNKSILIDAINRLDVPLESSFNANYYNVYCNIIITHFSQHYYRSFHDRYLPISAAWEKGNQMVLRDSIKRIWGPGISIYRLVRCIGKYYKDFSPVSVFKPWVARSVYNKYLPSGGVIVDPCMGWGGRLLGTIDLNYKYIGYDYNQLAVKSHEQLSLFLGSRLLNKPLFNNADTGITKLEQGDLLFTSPPYDNTEHYFGIDSKNTVTDPIYHNILGNFGGIVALNVPKRHAEMVLEIANQHNRRHLETLEMKTASFMGREKTFEPILIFDKKVI